MARHTTEQQHTEVHRRKPGQTYISPSDQILSPASQKLSNFKQRQINKQ